MPEQVKLNSPLGISCETILRASVSAKIGWRVETNNAFRARITLYKYRHENPNPEYANLQIRISPDDPEHDLWILNIDKEQVQINKILKDQFSEETKISEINEEEIII